MNKFKQEQLIPISPVKNYWTIHMGKANVFANEAYENNFIGIGWLEKIDLSKYSQMDRKEFIDKIIPFIAKEYPDKSLASVRNTAGQMFSFINLMKIDDIVLMPKTDEGRLYIGKVAGNYFYSNVAIKECNYPHRREIKWIKILNLAEFSQPLRNAIGAIMTIFSVSNYAQEIEQLILKISEGETVEDFEDFGMESHLEDFIIENWGKLELSKRYNLLKEDKKIISQQYIIPIGRIDILAKSKNDKEWLVIELKKGKNPNDVVSQTLTYMGWVKENLAEGSQGVKGLIIAGKKDEKISYALKMVNDIDFMTYTVNFKLKK